MTANSNKKPANPREQMEAAVEAGKETLEAAVKAGTDVAAKSVEKAVAMTREQVEAAVKVGTDAFKSYEDIVGFGKDNVDAVMKSGTVFVKGVQDLHKVMFGLAQASVEESVAATKALLGCKTLPEAIKVGSDYAKINYEKAMNESRKLSDLSLAVAENAISPLSARVNVAIEKITQPIAA
ncbi:MAG: TIGR01841 family phasin [Magnetospirillum sp. WYHS-4]